MVRIINGEIVSDNDPRVTGAQRRTAAGSRPQEQAGYGRVASLLDKSPQSDASGTSSSREYAPSEGGQQGRPPAAPGPIDKLSEMMGIQGMIVPIPGVLGMQKRDVPIIYFIFLGIAVLLFGWKVAAVAAFAYVLLNQTGSNQRQHHR